MADSGANRVTDAVKSDGVIDFYELLGEPADATTTRLRSRINDLYSEAQANRDHRNMSKRREYEMVLELLPKCRIALLEQEKRERYDQYLAQAKSGRPPVDFDTFMDQLSGKSQNDAEERASLLATKEGVEAAKSQGQTPSAKKSAAAKKPRTSVVGSIVSVIVFFAIFVVLHVIMHHNLGKSLLAAAIVGIVAWVVSNSDLPNRLSR